MTSDLVFDSCVMAKLVVPEADSTIAVQLAESTKQSGGAIWRLDLALIEVANVIWKQRLRKLIDQPAAELMLVKARQLSFQQVNARRHLPRGFEIALIYEIAVYDALFVAAVEALGCSGVTSDARLVQKAQNDFPQIQLLK